MVCQAATSFHVMGWESARAQLNRGRRTDQKADPMKHGLIGYVRYLAAVAAVGSADAASRRDKRLGYVLEERVSKKRKGLSCALCAEIPKF